MIMSSSYDSRGVLRGSCTLSHCSCVCYDGGVDMKKCIRVNCGHPPGKHEQLQVDTTSFGVSPSSTVTSQYGSAAAYSHYSDRPSQSPDHQPYQAAHSSHLPLCRAPGCLKRVHCDYSLPVDLPDFNYCSPQCRDSHLLPTEREKLRGDLENLKGILQAVSADRCDVAKPQLPVNQQSSANSTSLSSRVGWSKQTTPTGGSKKKEDQMTVQVTTTKERDKNFGLILSKKQYNLGKTFGFVVVGAVKRSRAYLELLDDKVRIFDVIEAINDKSCTELLIPSMDPQFCFDQYVDSQVSVKLHINRSISLPPLSNTLDVAQTERVDFTHVLALLHSSMATGDDGKLFGLMLSEPTHTSNFMVERILKETPAFNSGVQFGDRICLYAIASTGRISDCHLAKRKMIASILHDLRTAFAMKESVILLIQRH